MTSDRRQGSQQPIPFPDDISRPFWEAADHGRLAIQSCLVCGSFQHPPDAICRRCQSTKLGFFDVNGRGSVYTFAIYTRSFMDAFETPYVVALVDLDDHSDVRLMANIVSTRIEQVRIGIAVEVVFEQRRGCTLPQFRALESTAG